MIQLSDRTKNKIAAIRKRYTEEEIRHFFGNRDFIFSLIFENLGKEVITGNVKLHIYQWVGFELLMDFDLSVIEQNAQNV